MNPFKSPFTLVLAVAIAMAGCATTTQTSTQNKKSMLVAAGFKTITPKTAAQKQKLQNLPPGKIAMIKNAGRPVLSPHNHFDFPNHHLIQRFATAEIRGHLTIPKEKRTIKR